jgi:hypothetical protein
LRFMAFLWYAEWITSRSENIDYFAPGVNVFLCRS